MKFNAEVNVPTSDILDYLTFFDNTPEDDHPAITDFCLYWLLSDLDEVNELDYEKSKESLDFLKQVLGSGN